MKLPYLVFLLGVALSGFSALPATAATPHLSPLRVEADPHTRAAVAAVVSCQPSAQTEAALADGLLVLAGVDPDDYADEPLRLRLPENLTVLGARTDLIAVGSGVIHAVLANMPADTHARAQGLSAHYYPRSEGRWIKSVAVRNDGDGWLRQRVIEVDADPQRPTDTRVGCSEVIDSRRQQQERAGDVSPMTFADDTDVLALAPEILMCRSDRRNALTLTTSLLLDRAPAAPFADWVDESGAGRLQWALPRPLHLRDVEVRRLRYIMAVGFGVVKTASAAELAQRWQLSPSESDPDERIYFQDLPVQVAPDGWEEHRRLLVLDDEEGDALAGCRYSERVSEFGWWPGDTPEEIARDPLP